MPRGGVFSVAAASGGDLVGVAAVLSGAAF